MEINREDDFLNQYLIFSLAGLYAIDIKYVVEVLEYTKISAIPSTPDYMLGVINNRGKIVPVLDLKKQLGIIAAPYHNKVDYKRDVSLTSSNIIILRLNFEGEEINIGILVDEVSEVLSLNFLQIEDANGKYSDFTIKFIKGIAQKGDDFIVVLLAEKLFDIKKLSMLENPATYKVSNTREV